MCFAGLMKFKELFGSFTGHRIEKRNIGTHYGSNGSETSGNWKSGFENPSPTGTRPSATPLG
ncbi:hypothetical protein HanHA300_Chr12g0444691 [Helianthus annuus]|nr:hypothetical protein HanHA300_Chr12g0444691 [Helianthus annuus]